MESRVTMIFMLYNQNQSTILVIEGMTWPIKKMFLALVIER